MDDIKAPGFHFHNPPDPVTGKTDTVWVELDPGDGGNFQTHMVACVRYDAANGNWKVETKTYQLRVTVADKDQAIKEAMKLLMTDWAAQ